MANSWDEMRKAKEEAHFEKKNKEALERIASKKQPEGIRLSPVTGEPMEKVVIHGVVVDRCLQSGGVWLDKGELEQLMKIGSADETSENWITNFIKTLSGN